MTGPVPPPSSAACAWPVTELPPRYSVPGSSVNRIPVMCCTVTVQLPLRPPTEAVTVVLPPLVVFAVTVQLFPLPATLTRLSSSAAQAGA